MTRVKEKMSKNWSRHIPASLQTCMILVFLHYVLSLCSVPLLQKLPTEKLSKLADVLEVVSMIMLFS